MAQAQYVFPQRKMNEEELNNCYNEHDESCQFDSWETLHAKILQQDS